MGKKNRTYSMKQKQKQEESSMEDHNRSEKQLQNQKNLYAALLKQTKEDKEKIESLVKANDTLEAENTQLHDELLNKERINKLLKRKRVSVKNTAEINELKRVNKGLMSEINGLLVENNLVKGEMKVALITLSDKEKLVDKLLLEKDELLELNVNKKAEFDKVKKVADDLTKTNEEIRTKVSQIKDAMVLVEVERDNTKKALDEEKRNHLALKETIEATSNELEKVKNEGGILIKEKKELENQYDILRNENGTLQNDSLELKTVMVALKTELESARTNAEHGLTMLKSVSSLVCGLENKKCEQEQENEMNSYLEAIKKAFKDKENMVESLVMEKNSIGREKEIALIKLSDKEKLFDQLLLEKDKLFELNVNLSKVADDLTKTNKELSKKVSRLNDVMALFEVERDNTKKALKEKIVELEKNIKELEKVKLKKNKLIKEKKEVQNRYDILRNEKGILQKDSAELKNTINVLRTELESARANAKYGLTMLKSLSSLLCGLDNKKGEQKQEKGMDSYIVELEAIKKAFQNKENMIESLLMENKLIENQKEISLFQLSAKEKVFDQLLRERDKRKDNKNVEELSKLKAAIALVKVERDGTMKVLEKERKNQVDFKEDFVDHEKGEHTQEKRIEFYSAGRSRMRWIPKKVQFRK